MKKKLFGKRINPDCSYCSNISDYGDYSACSKNKKIKNGKCGSFIYDPLMRTPKSEGVSKIYSIDDFKI